MTVSFAVRRDGLPNQSAAVCGLRSCCGALLVALLLTAPARAGQSTCQARDPSTGINTSRLSSKMLERWCSLERLALTTNATGRPRYPMLSFLLKWAETSGHLIYIELPEQTSFSDAGRFYIESLDTCGERHVVVISLYLAIIDQAYVGVYARRADGLIPFAGLSKEERYAEVLGHELAHAFHILNDYELTQMVEGLVQQTNKQFLAFRARHRYLPPDPELQKKMAEKDAFLEELEGPAMSFEKIIWRELKEKGK
jgi:hypothetical protein